jgi:hypothetical protein
MKKYLITTLRPAMERHIVTVEARTPEEALAITNRGDVFDDDYDYIGVGEVDYRVLTGTEITIKEIGEVEL